MTTQTQNKNYDWCIVYRTGGTENFTWHRSLAMSQEAAQSAKEACQRGGRMAYVVRYSQSVNIGLPSTYAGTQWEIADARKAEELANI